MTNTDRPASDSLAWLELLVGGARAEDLAAHAGTLAERTGTWNAVLERAAAERLLPRLVTVLRTAPGGAAPAALAEAERGVLARALAWTAHLRRTLAALRRAGVRPLLFKGAALGVLLEGHPEGRGFGDVDLLVRRTERDRAARALEALGLVPDWPVPSLGTSPMRSSGGVAFRAAGRPAVDLHWVLGTPLVPCRLEQAGVFARAREVELGEGCTALTFGPEDTLLHLCFHGAKDDWSYWLNVADVSGVLRADTTLDVDLLKHLAHRLGLRRVLRTGLLLAAALGRATVPAGLASWMCSDPEAVRLAAEARERLRSGAPVDQSMRARVTRALRNRERWIDRSQAIVGVLARVSAGGMSNLWHNLHADDRPALGGWPPGSDER